MTTPDEEPRESDEIVFRDEALAAHASARPRLRRITPQPSWLTPVYRLMFVAAALAVPLVGLAEIHDYASGPAVVYLGATRGLQAELTATVKSVDVVPGERVAAGAVLMRFEDGPLAMAYDSSRSRFESAVLTMLADPRDRSARAAVGEAQVELALARRQLDAMQVRTPGPAVITAVRVKRGQFVRAGDTLVTLTESAEKPHVLMFFAGHSRPFLTAGMTVRLEMSGFRQSEPQWLLISEVGDQVIGPAEARKLLGPDVADAVTLGTASVAVRAALDSTAFVVDGQPLALVHQMTGRAEISLRTRRIVDFALAKLAGQE